MKRYKNSEIRGMNIELESWRDDLTLIGNLSAVNRQISAYVLHALDADACRDEPTAPSHEHSLGARLVDLGNELQARASRHAISTQRCTTTEHPARNKTQDRPREPRARWANHTTAIYTP